MAAWTTYGSGRPGLRRSPRRRGPRPRRSRPVPSRAVLLGQRHGVAGGGETGGAPRVLQEQQCQQAEHGRLVRHQPVQQPGQAQCLVGGRRAVGPPVALGEHQVHRRRDPVQPVGQLRGVRHPVRDVGAGDLLLRPRQALGHRRLGHEQRTAHLGGRQPAERVQGQCDLCLERQRRMAAGEHQPQLVVAQHLGRLAARRSSSAMASASFPVRRASRRTRSTARLRAVSVSHARGWGGTPVRGQMSSARRTASCTASSASCRSPVCRTSVASTRRPSSRTRRTRAACARSGRVTRTRSPAGPPPPRARPRGCVPRWRSPRRGRRTPAGRSR